MRLDIRRADRHAAHFRVRLVVLPTTHLHELLVDGVVGVQERHAADVGEEVACAFLADRVAHRAHWASELDYSSDGREARVVADAAPRVASGVCGAWRVEELLAVELDG